MYEKNNVKFIFYVVAIILFALLCTITRSKNGTDTAGTVSNIREQQQSIKVEIGNIDSSLGEAGTTIAGANQRVDELQTQVDNVRERLAQSKREINNLSKLARECKEIAERNGEILDDIRKKNQ